MPDGAVAGHQGRRPPVGRWALVFATFLRMSPAWAASTAPVFEGDFPDPYVTRAPDGTYYAYSTQVGSLNVPVTSSADLATWRQAADALPILPSWAAWGRTCAPAVLKRGSTWVLWYTTGTRPGVSSASR